MSAYAVCSVEQAVRAVLTIRICSERAARAALRSRWQTADEAFAWREAGRRGHNRARLATNRVVLAWLLRAAAK